MDRYFKTIDVHFVLVDNFSGMKSGIEHLLKKDYKKILYITVDLDLIHMKEREEGFKAALSSHKLASSSKDILRLKYDLTKDEAVAEISRFIKKAKSPEAIVFATNYLGIYGLQSIKDIGLKIPEDIGVLCFDDHDVFVHPTFDDTMPKTYAQKSPPMAACPRPKGARMSRKPA